MRLPTNQRAGNLGTTGLIVTRPALIYSPQLILEGAGLLSTWAVVPRPHFSDTHGKQVAMRDATYTVPRNLLLDVMTYTTD